MIVKVCGVRTPEVAEAALAAGADWIGLVLEPRSPRFAGGAEADAVREAVGGRGLLVGVLVGHDPERDRGLVRRHRLDALQLHGDVPARALTDSPVPVIRGLNVASIAEAVALEWPPDCLLLLDAAPIEAEALPGGTGRRVDLDLAAAVARHRAVLLAGGLDAGGVGAAIATVRPAGVDASSGLESSPGVKDVERVRAFVRAARAAGAASPG